MIGWCNSTFGVFIYGSPPPLLKSNSNTELVNLLNDQFVYTGKAL